jgi:transcriptional regulator with XRE-family HTH domain
MFNRLRFLRQLRGLNQLDIAQTLNRSQSYASQLERGIVQPTDNERATLSKLFNVSESWLFEAEKCGE